MSIYKIEAKNLQMFCQNVFETLGLDRTSAQTVAENLLEAELRGVKSHGIARIKGYVHSLTAGEYNTVPNIRILRQNSAVLAIDGDWAMGAVSGKWAMQHCIAKANKAGAGFATVGKGRHFGIAAYYAMMALQEDMIGIALCNSEYNMNVYGGTTRVLGTNPICIAVPAQLHYPLVFDAATSQVAFNRIKNAALEGTAIPEGWALDSHGRPTTDAQEALIGGVVHFGGYKGSGLAVMVQVLSGILSSAFQSAAVDGSDNNANGVGFFFGAIRIADFLDTATFKQGVDSFIDQLKKSRLDENIQALHMPGEIEYLKKAEHLKNGIIISPAILEELLEVQQLYEIAYKLEYETLPE